MDFSYKFVLNLYSFYPDGGVTGKSLKSKRENENDR